MILKQNNSFEKLLSLVFFSCTIFFTTIVFSCNDSKASSESPDGYNFSGGYRYTLPGNLNEISGLSYYATDSSVFAINDEKGFLFKIHFSNPLRIDRWKFGSGADYEDIVFQDSTFFVLKSKGSLDKIRFTGGDSVSLENFPIPAQGKNEFESLYYDDSLKKLVVICKNCEIDNKSQVTCFTFNPATNNFDSTFQFNTEKFNQQDGEKVRFKPSAAAVHPLTGELFIIASVNRMLVVLNKDKSVKGTYHLDSKLFKQPEGMTFTPKGDLLISNESGTVGPADILIFKYNPLNKRQ
jgi:uncharacterized protein YjiK